MKLLYFAIELNLLLWLGLLALLLSERGEASTIKLLVIGGFVLAAVVQHWAYYRLRNQRPATT